MASLDTDISYVHQFPERIKTVWSQYTLLLSLSCLVTTVVEAPLALAQSPIEDDHPPPAAIRVIPACDFLDISCLPRLQVQVDPVPLVPSPETAGSTLAPLQTGPTERRIQPPSRFDRSLDALVRDGVVAPSEVRVHPGLITNPLLLQGCSNGAFSARECGGMDEWDVLSGRSGRGKDESVAPRGAYAPPPPPGSQYASEQSLPKSQAAIRDRLEYLRQEEDRLRALDEAKKRIEAEKIRLAEERKWRKYGKKMIKWDEWKLYGNGIRITQYEIAKEPDGQLSAPPEPVASSSAVVRFGDTLLKISQRYGLSIAELLRLNPGLDTARLVVGSQIQVAQPARGNAWILLGSGPAGSGGLNWPEHSQFGNSQRELYPSTKVPKENLVAISCVSLKISYRPLGEDWKEWSLPSPGSSDEKLIIDLCSNIRM